MHVGNLRTALFEYLIAKSQGGQFVLRIEDTDQERLVEGATQVIYDTLRQVGLQHDEGPDIGGEYGPYVQSERKDLYLPYAKKLVELAAPIIASAPRSAWMRCMSKMLSAAMTVTAVTCPKKKWIVCLRPARLTSFVKKCRLLGLQPMTT